MNDSCSFCVPKIWNQQGKRKTLLKGGCILLVLSVSLCITQESTTESDNRTDNVIGSFFTIQYKETGSDPNLTSLDIYTPSHSGVYPVVIYVHGGGWEGGDKKNVRYKPEFFNDEGFVFISVNYRLSPEVNHPDHVQDVADAVAWVVENISQYGGDPDAIFIMGHSAGAHLVSLLGTDETYLENSGYTLDVLKGVISLDTGSLDIPLQVETQKGSLRRVKTAIGDDLETWKDASPIYHVEAGKSIPPYLVVYASSREYVTGAQARIMKEKFDEEGLFCEVYRAENKTHGSLNQELGAEGDEPSEKIIEFIRGILQELSFCINHTEPLQLYSICRTHYVLTLA